LITVASFIDNCYQPPIAAVDSAPEQRFLYGAIRKGRASKLNTVSVEREDGARMSASTTLNGFNVPVPERE
jgi:hypothetical protein